MQTRKPPLRSRSLEAARELRAAQTEAELRLWSRLRAGQLNGLKFRRQHPVPPYIVDFYCHALHLVIEIDGSQHSVAADRTRSTYLESLGLTLSRFNANDVVAQTDGVLEAILNFASSRTLTPTPVPQGEGLEASSTEESR